MAARGKPTSSERAALGRPASLGQHYDVINDQLLNTSFFRDPQNTLEFARHSPDMKTTCNTFSVEDSFSGRLDGLNIPLDQKLGLMFGVHEKLESNYDELIRWKKTTHRIITGTLIHTIYTTTEELDTSRAQDAANVLKTTRRSRYSKTTYVVSGITRGYQLILTFHRRVVSSFETEVVKTELKDFISEVRSNFTNPDALRDIFQQYRHFDLGAELHGYVKQAYENWDVFCDTFPEWLKHISANKDQPIMIKIHKIEGFGYSYTAGFTEIGKDNFKEIEDHFQGINNAKCAFTDFCNDVRNNQESITRPKLRDIHKIIKKIESDLEIQTSQMSQIIKSNRSSNTTVYMIFSKFLINESKIMKELSKFENSVAAHAVIAEMKARGCGIIHPQSKLQKEVDGSYEMLVFHYYPNEKGLFKSSIWMKNYEFFIKVMKKSTQKYEFYLMEHENPGLLNKFVGKILFSNPASAYVSHYYCGEEKSNNCIESPDSILLKNISESLTNPHQETRHDTDVQKMIDNCHVNTVSKQTTYTQALSRNDPTVVSVQESYTHPLTEGPYATNTEATDQVSSSTNLVVLQPDSQLSSEAGNRKPTITLDGEFGNAELTAEELRHNLKVFGGSVSRPSKAVHSVGCPEYNVKGSDNSVTSSGNNDPSCGDETSSISKEEGQHLAMASSRDYDPLNRMQNQSMLYGCPNKLSGLGRGGIAGIPNREVAVTSNLFASKSTIKSDLFSSEVQETRSQIIQNERRKITAKDNDHFNDVRNLVEDPNDIIKCDPKTNESGNGSKKISSMGMGRGRGRPPIIYCTDATKRNSKANECEMENTKLSIHDGDQDKSLASAEPSHNNDESEKDAMKNYVSQVTATDKNRENDFCQNNYNNGTSKPSQKRQGTDEAVHPYDGGRNGKKYKYKQENGKSKDKTEAEEPSIYIKDQVKYEQLQFLTDLFQDQETDTTEAVDTVFPDETDITCLANSRTDFEKTPPLSEEELEQFPVLRMKCPAYLYGNCKLREVHEWVCNNCQTHLLYGLDTYIYCVQCGKTRANVLSFKCSHVTHGDEFFTFPNEDELLGILEKLRDRDELNILILGETGVGKTTFINAFANYLTYDTLSEAENSELIGLIPSTFTLSDENYEEITIKFGVADSNESEEEGASKTQACKCYSFPCGDKMVKLIDTPGIGDTKGIDQDAKNFVNILSFISNFSNIHGILLLMKPNNDRLNIFFRFCIQELLKHLHKSASENINFVFTNSKSTFYRPGDTFRPLKKLLSELQDITIPLNADTIYCLDNDSFRFLVASHNNVKFTENDLKEYTTSWAKSAKECERLLKRVAQLKPHSVKDTLSINGARRLIVLLAQPLGDIIMVIQENLYFLNEQMKTLAASQNNIEKLRNCLFVPAVEVKLSHYPNPRTICKATSCSKITENGEYPICHDPCYLTEITPDIVNNEQLKKCAVINDSTGCCHSCGCSWKGHMRVLYEMKKINVKKMDNTAASGIQNWKARQEKAEETKLELELRRKEFLNELDYVTKASAIFTYFLMKNSLTQQSDFIKNYLEALIEIEKRKQNLKGGSCSETSGLIRELQKAVAGYSKELDRLNREGMEVTAQEIEVHASRLYSLEKFGSSFKSIAEKHEEALFREVALYSERVYVPKSGGNCKARRNKRFHFNATED